jgi:hypothetical protein
MERIKAGQLLKGDESLILSKKNRLFLDTILLIAKVVRDLGRGNLVMILLKCGYFISRSDLILILTSLEKLGYLTFHENEQAIPPYTVIRTTDKETII